VNDVDLRYLSEIRHLVFEYAGCLGAWKRGAQAGYLFGFLRGRRGSLSKVKTPDLRVIPFVYEL